MSDAFTTEDVQEYYGNMIPVYRAYTIAAIDVVLHEHARGGVVIEFDHAEYGQGGHR